MSVALAYKRRETRNASEEIIRIAESMTEKELEEMASKPKKKRKKE